jgi:hypothetical protein
MDPWKGADAKTFPTFEFLILNTSSAIFAAWVLLIEPISYNIVFISLNAT